MEFRTPLQHPASKRRREQQIWHYVTDLSYIVFLFRGIHVRHNGQKRAKNRTLLSKLLKTASLVDVFRGGGAIYVMFQAVISHCIISPAFSRAWMNRFPVGELH